MCFYHGVPLRVGNLLFLVPIRCSLSIGFACLFVVVSCLLYRYGVPRRPVGFVACFVVPATVFPVGYFLICISYIYRLCVPWHRTMFNSMSLFLLFWLLSRTSTVMVSLGWLDIVSIDTCSYTIDYRLSLAKK